YEEQQFFNHSAAYGQRSVKDSSIDKSQRPLRIFLLDDDPQVFEYFEFLVTKLPFATQLSHAADSEMGQALVSNTRFDLYILDFDLAGEKNGWDFYQEHLHYLGQEVLFQTTQNEQVLMGSQTRQALRPLRSEEHTSELQSRENLVCRLLLENKKAVPFGSQI